MQKPSWREARFLEGPVERYCGYTGRLNHQQILHEIEPGKAAARTDCDKAQPMG
jgi:hypothetical protein